MRVHYATGTYTIEHSMSIQAMKLVWPAAEYLLGYIHALQQCWSPDNLRPHHLRRTRSIEWQTSEDRVGEAARDEREKRQAGINHVRFHSIPP